MGNESLGPYGRVLLVLSPKTLRQPARQSRFLAKFRGNVSGKSPGVREHRRRCKTKPEPKIGRRLLRPISGNRV